MLKNLVSPSAVYEPLILSFIQHHDDCCFLQDTIEENNFVHLMPSITLRIVRICPSVERLFLKPF